MPKRQAAASAFVAVTDLVRIQSIGNMGQVPSLIEKSTVFLRVGKVVALAASTGAALVTVVTALYSYGVIGQAESHKSIGNMGAAWVGLRPLADTAFAIGDTTHFAATIADNSGSILVGARPTWTTGDSSVAVVRADGSVIARGPGTTTVSVVVGALVAHSKVYVQQRVASVVVGSSPADTIMVVPEGAEQTLAVRAYDARGHLVKGRAVEWTADDTTVAAVDAKGTLAANHAGRTWVTAKVDGSTGRAGITVIATASSIALVAGTNQHAMPGATLPQQIVVRATHRRGGAATGQRVTFKPADGQGSVEPRTVLTDADGRARVSWTLGDYPGRQTLLATMETVDSALAIAAESDPVAANTRVTALVEQLRGRAGEPLPDSVAVRVTDSTGRALPDIPVRWTVDAGGAVEAIAARTDSLGVARARWTLAKRTGTQAVRALVGGASSTRGIPPVTISAHALAGAPAALVAVSGEAQRGMAGATLAKPIVVRVTDANGSGVGGTTLQLTASSGSVPDREVTTDERGTASVRWTMGRTAGPHTLSVRAEGVNTLLKIAALTVPGRPANLSFDDAPAPTPATHAKVKDRRRHLFAVVTDEYGNPVPDVAVGFSTKSGTVTPARAVSDTRGRAALTWTPGTKAGEQTLAGAVRSTDVRGKFTMEVSAAAQRRRLPRRRLPRRRLPRAPRPAGRDASPVG